MEHNKETFQFTYSAKEQEEIKRIRQKYTVPETEDKMAKLRKLDASVYEKASMVALIVGIVGALILGSGMSLTMTELGAHLGMSQFMSMLIGIVVGLVGIVTVSLAYPLYHFVLKKEREKAAPEILRLTDALMK